MTDRASGVSGFDLSAVPSPCHVIDVEQLEANLACLKHISDHSGAKVLLALKAFSCFAVADLISSYVAGTAASGLWEARLGKTRFGGEVHSYVPGLKSAQLDELCRYSDHLILNSLGQYGRFAGELPSRNAPHINLRINPRYSEVETPLYDPCGALSRLGVPVDQLSKVDLEPFSGLHVHGLCDQGYAPFDRLLTAVEERAGHLFGQIQSINLGGGHLITQPGYPVEKLADRLKDFAARTGLQIYIEPGTAVALNAGALVTEVLDTGWNEGHFAIVDVSATCHMPDVIEAPYVPDIAGAEKTDKIDASDARSVRLGGPTCLAGDVLGTYRFKEPLKVGDRLMIEDQAYYTMVKASTFNGTPLPSIALWDSRSGELSVVREFDYPDFESRLG